jgi:hypothetical protein
VTSTESRKNSKSQRGARRQVTRIKSPSDKRGRTGEKGERRREKERPETHEADRVRCRARTCGWKPQPRGFGFQPKGQAGCLRHLRARPNQLTRRSALQWQPDQTLTTDSSDSHGWGIRAYLCHPWFSGWSISCRSCLSWLQPDRGPASVWSACSVGSFSRWRVELRLDWNSILSNQLTRRSALQWQPDQTLTTDGSDSHGWRSAIIRAIRGYFSRPSSES